MADPDDREERLFYPQSWDDEYRRTMTVAAWTRTYPDWFPPGPHSGQAKKLDLLAQYALMYLLAERERVQSVTWLYLADVDAGARARAKSGDSWKPAGVRPRSKNKARTERHWATMRRCMGDASFDALQQAIVRADFHGFAGEPDLFCFDPTSGVWFFAEAKRKDKLGKKQTNADGTGWFDVAEKTLGAKGRVRVIRVLPAK
jgi:hypothetical protein